MGDPHEVWGDVLGRLGLVPVCAVEDGLRYAVDTAAARIEADIRVFRDPVTVRLVVRPLKREGAFLLAPADRVRTPVRWKTGDARFDERVAILSGGRTVLARLGPAERERLIEVVGEIGALVGAEEATLEPTMTARFTDPKDALATTRDLVRITTRLAEDPPFEDLLDRWFQQDPALAVGTAVARRVVEILPDITEEQAAAACHLVMDRSDDGAIALLSVMPPYPCVLAAWFRLGDFLDPRVLVRVVDAWRAGSPRPAARYLGTLLGQSGPGPADVARRLWETPGLADDPVFLKEFVRAIRAEPPPGALPLLLEVKPPNSSVARRVAKVLETYPSADVDARLLEWLSADSNGTRVAAAGALADRAASELASGARTARLDQVAAAAERSRPLLHALLERVPPAHTGFLVPLRPRDEPEAVALIQRLGQGGAEVDEALLFWLDRGTLQVRLEAARALGAAGSARAIPALRDRAGGWFSDGGVREACKGAMEAIRRRTGGSGALAIAPGVGGEVSPSAPTAALPDPPRPRRPEPGEG